MERKYRIIEVGPFDGIPNVLGIHYVVQVHRWFGWVNIKWFYDPDDESYALRCAEELLEKLNEEI